MNNFTVLSLKTTLLFYLHELPSVTGDDRNAQDHRGSSKKLYSRDVLGALRCQQQLCEAVLKGFILRTPQHRGGQVPLASIPIHLEMFSKALDTQPWGFFKFNCAVPGQLLLITQVPTTLDAQVSAASAVAQANASTEHDSAGEESQDSDFTPRDELGPADEITLVTTTGILHAAGAQTSMGHARSLCGTFLKADRCQTVDRVLPSHRLCRRAACVSAFAALDMQI